MSTTTWTEYTPSSADYTEVLQAYYLLTEEGDYLLQEDQAKILLESSIKAIYTEVTASSSSWTETAAGTAVWS